MDCTHLTDAETKEREVKEFAQGLTAGKWIYTQGGWLHSWHTYPLPCDALKNPGNLKISKGFLVESWTVVSTVATIEKKKKKKAPLKAIYSVHSRLLSRDIFGYIQMD